MNVASECVHIVTQLLVTAAQLPTAASRVHFAHTSVTCVQGNHFSCSSAQDKGYLNLTSCAQAAGSAQA